MQFQCGKKRDDNIKKATDWHRWFAWYPVKMDYIPGGDSSDRGGKGPYGHKAEYDCRWLEVVERRSYFGEVRLNWYRPLMKPEHPYGPNFM